MAGAKALKVNAMSFSLWFREHLPLLVLLALCVGLLFVALKHVAKVERRLLYQRNEPEFKQVLAANGIDNVVILKDSSKPGTQFIGGYTGSLFEVHLILHSPPSQWFAYIHIEGSSPVLTSISEERAQAAVM
jgi:hypothetical protein